MRECEQHPLSACRSGLHLAPDAPSNLRSCCGATRRQLTLATKIYPFFFILVQPRLRHISGRQNQFSQGMHSRHCMLADNMLADKMR